MNPIPGHFKCPNCRFQLTKSILFARDGTTCPDWDAAPELCPNDGTPMQQAYEQPDDKLVAVDADGFGIGWYYRASPETIFSFAEQELT